MLRNRTTLWNFIVTVFVAITLIFWEVAIAVQVYEAQNTASVDNINPHRFAVVENSVAEYIIKVLTNRKSGWEKVKSFDEAYKMLDDPTNHIDSTIHYGFSHRYHMMKHPERCNKLRLYEEVPFALVEHRKPPQISGAWFYSSMVPLTSRTSIDKEIARIKEKGIILNIVEGFVGHELRDDCKFTTSRIDWILLGLLHIIVSGIPSAMLIIWIISGTIKRLIIRRLTREDFDDTRNGSTRKRRSSKEPMPPSYPRECVLSRDITD